MQLTSSGELFSYKTFNILWETDFFRNKVNLGRNEDYFCNCHAHEAKALRDNEEVDHEATYYTQNH